VRRTCSVLASHSMGFSHRWVRVIPRLGQGHYTSGQDHQTGGSGSLHRWFRVIAWMGQGSSRRFVVVFHRWVRVITEVD
jgi:hypothetical protein